jgi:hypothetical protein
MRWWPLLDPWIAQLLNDAQLVALLGASRIYPAQASRPVTIPSVEWQTVADDESESFNVIRIQLDFWARGVEAAGAIERRLRTVLHHETAFELNGERLWSRYIDSRSIDYLNEPGVLHRALDFELEAIRGRYIPDEES